MTRRAATIIAAVAVVAVLALFALRAAPSGTPGSGEPVATASATLAAATATASATASAPGPTPTVAASPSPTAAAADRYGYVFAAQEERIVVRRERDAAPASMQGPTSPTPGSAVIELAGVSPAVSSDGKRLAYWRTTPNVGATDLRVLDVADPTSDRSVLTVTDEALGGDVVWSNDGQGLLVAIRSREGVGPFSAPARYDLLMIDLTSTPPVPRAAAAQMSGGRVYLPVAWDRPGQVAAAVVTGEGGYATEYVTWSGNAASPFARAPIPRPLVLADRVRASADARLVLALEDNLTGLRVWPIEDLTKSETISHPSRILSAFWRPGFTAPYEVIWTVGSRVELFRYRTDSSTVLYTGTGNVAAVAVRPDGSAVLITDSSGGPPPPTTRLLVVDVATRQTTDISTTVGGVHPLHRGVLVR